ncbi:MAG: hypothetical protein DRJ02_09925 [Bacteroidetes bacterium]|nr:MAG: hypothetical protein DRI72_02150 [Bacteroidota bacterium]RLD85685.1 MAG: hypothetical protein DRJ02_09925 [Bacteroidota bacterium]
MKKACSVIILAAGNSARMGQIKFTLRMKDGKTFLEHIIEQFSEFGCKEIVVVVNRNGYSFLEQHSFRFNNNVHIIVNEHPEYGRFYSLKQGLPGVSGGQFVFIHNADNPFVEKSVLEDLYAAREEAAIIKPVHKGKGGHPVLIADKIRSAILAVTENDIRLDDFLRKYAQKKITTGSEKIHVNVNTKEDLRKLDLFSND